jgi:hypothetical protein
VLLSALLCVAVLCCSVSDRAPPVGRRPVRHSDLHRRATSLWLALCLLALATLATCLLSQHFVCVSGLLCVWSGCGSACSALLALCLTAHRRFVAGSAPPVARSQLHRRVTRALACSALCLLCLCSCFVCSACCVSDPFLSLSCDVCLCLWLRLCFVCIAQHVKDGLMPMVI